MAFQVEYLTKATDYDLDTKQQVFYVLTRGKYLSEVFSEKIPVPPEYYLRKPIPIDSLTSWRISNTKKDL